MQYFTKQPTVRMFIFQGTLPLAPEMWASEKVDFGWDETKSYLVLPFVNQVHPIKCICTV